MKDFSEQFDQAIEQDSRATSVDRIETRSCASDNYDGIEYNIYGRFVSIWPIIDVLTEESGYAIEQLYHCLDAEEPHVGVFVADVPEQSHADFVYPAFV